jgi:ankyrin repeat protein
MMAAVFGSTEIAVALIGAGADVNAQNKSGNTALI